MKKNGNIPILNIYYMIAYAYSAIDLLDEAEVKAEEFENAADMLAFVFGRCLVSQLKKGLERNYAEVCESLPVVRGRVDLLSTLTPPESMYGRAVCSYSEYSEDTQLNRILKTTLLFLLRQEKVSLVRKVELRRMLSRLALVGEIADIRGIQWKSLSYHRNNRTYRFLMGLCYLILHDLINSESEGPVQMLDFEDSKQLHSLYERFILGYFQVHYAGILNASAPQIKIDESKDASPFLPVLRTDVVLESDNKMLVIDAKFYSKSLANSFGKKTLHANNVAQIFQYVALLAHKNSHTEVSGMLLYAKTNDTHFVVEKWTAADYVFEARSLDLGQEFDIIRAQLDKIAKLVLE